MAWPGWPDAISPAELVTSTWLTNVSTSLAFLEEVNYTEFTSSVTVSATTAATANDVVSSGAISYEAVPHMIEFYSPRVLTGSASNLLINLWDDTTDMGRIGQVSSGANTMSAAIHAMRRLTPSAATHTYKIKAWRDAANGTITAGAGGVDVHLPGFIRITRCPT